MLRSLLPAALVVQVFVVVACGGLSLPRQTPAPPPPVSPPATSASAPEAARPVALVMSITVAERPAEMPDYDRDDWDHWNDADRDCQDTRQEVLVAESSVAVRFTDDRECRVASGRWADPYTGDTVEDPGKLDVDHMVPLANAHASGGHAWSEQRKELYANSLIYPEHLVAVTASANRSKGANGPDGWRPPNRTYWCRYASDWIAIKNEWGLTATEPEAVALREMLETCGHSVFLQVSDPEDAPPTPTPVVTAATPYIVTLAMLTTATPLNTPRARYDPAGPDRICSDFDGWEEAQAFYLAAGGPDSDPHGLDKDGNGVACESLPGGPRVTMSFPRSSDADNRPSTPTPESNVPGIKYDPAGPDRNCSDFATWSQAQAFYAAAGGPASDRHRLDRDGNGIACESLPGAPIRRASPTPAPTPQSPTPTPQSPTPTPQAPTPTPTPQAPESSTPGTEYDPSGPDRNCSDFATWAEAQAFYEAAGGPGSDRHRLDRDGNGNACESLPGAPSQRASPTPAPAPQSPTPTPQEPTPTPESSTPGTDPSGPDRNCSDFATWAEAQAFYEAAGGPETDRHRLDRDRNGIACESLPGAPIRSASPTPAPTPQSPTPTPESSTSGTDPGGPDRNCSDFATWAEAQAFYEAAGGPETDRHRLDRDRNGIACESLPGAPIRSASPTPAPTPQSPTPTPESSTSGTDPGGPDRNCSDFATWAEAQAFYEAAGGPETDRHRLDRDRNGIACESLPGAPSQRASPTPTPTPQSPTPAPESSTPGTDPSGPDRNCSDFDTWAEAQAFYEAAGGPETDRHRLDRDRNGIACESLPGAPVRSASPTPTPTPTPQSPTPAPQEPTPAPESSTPGTDPSGPDRNCSDFDTWAEAQAFYEAAGGPETDRHRLDRDGDGIACESLPGAPSQRASPTPTPTPTPQSPTPAPQEPTPAPESSTPGTDPSGPDRNCSDFDTWAEAQAFYEAAGGPETDRHRLDRDRNGIACESLPGAPG